MPSGGTRRSKGRRTHRNGHLPGHDSRLSPIVYKKSLSEWKIRQGAKRLIMALSRRFVVAQQPGDREARMPRNAKPTPPGIERGGFDRMRAGGLAPNQPGIS